MEDGHRIIAMLNQKGGVGKTTTTVNLGAAIAREGNRVLLVDLDPQAHLTLHLGVEPDAEDTAELTIYDLLLDREIDPKKAITSLNERLDIIASEVDLAAAEVELAPLHDRYLRLAEHLSSLRGEYDYILLDCPPSLGLLTINALACAGEVIVPMQAHFLALQGVSKLLETVSLISEQVNPGLRVTGVVLCMHDTSTRLSGEVVADLKQFFEQNRDLDVPWRDARLLTPHIRRNIKLAEAPSFGLPIFDYEPNCAGAEDYAALARQVIQLGKSVKEKPAPEENSEDNDRDKALVVYTRPTGATTAVHSKNPAESVSGEKVS
ncbi:MAG TPA: ParA family protein [Phycisphaeraceae bacterium]|nr:ParA family protein [Phycisphaeraceae bacterium]